MEEVNHSYKSSTHLAFKQPIQDTILQLNQQAILDGFERTKDNFRFVISQVETNWVIVLLVFVSGKAEPKEYIETIPFR